MISVETDFELTLHGFISGYGEFADLPSLDGLMLVLSSRLFFFVRTNFFFFSELIFFLSKTKFYFLIFIVFLSHGCRQLRVAEIGEEIREQSEASFLLCFPLSRTSSN